MVMACILRQLFFLHLLDSQYKIQHFQLILIFDGEVISPDATADDIGVDEGDLIDVKVSNARKNNVWN